MNFSVRLTCLLSLACTALSAQDSLLPLPEGGFDLSVQCDTTEVPASDLRFMKPTASIKPPAPAVNTAAALAMQPQVTAPTVARLRKLILMPGGLPPEAIREQILANGKNRTPVTVLGMDAPAPILTNLANFFGGDVNAQTQKQLLDTVSNGLSKEKTARRRVEVVSWQPSEGVMAVAVYPES